VRSTRSENINVFRPLLPRRYAVESFVHIDDLAARLRRILPQLCMTRAYREILGQSRDIQNSRSGRRNNRWSDLVPRIFFAPISLAWERFGLRNRNRRTSIVDATKTAAVTLTRRFFRHELAFSPQKLARRCAWSLISWTHGDIRAAKIAGIIRRCIMECQSMMEGRATCGYLASHRTAKINRGQFHFRAGVVGISPMGR
jgi:hypothetical protein